MHISSSILIISLAFSALGQVDVGNGGVQAPCPASTPVRCSNSACVADYTSCPINNCTGLTPFQCSDGKCAISSIYCNCQGVICSDGSCKPSFSQCKILEGCPELFPKRCGDGSCAVYNSNCVNHTGPTCPSPLTKCMDGICRLAANCNGIPYYGCPAFQCADGSCAATYTSCLCLGDTTKVKCFDKTCVPLGTACANMAPALINPMNLTYTVTTNTAAIITIPTTQNTSPLATIATIALPAGAVNQAASGVNLVNVGGVASAVTQGTTVVSPISGTSAPAVLVTPAINVNIGNSQSQLNSPGTVTFNNLPTTIPASNLCVAVLNETSGTWSCVGGNTTTSGIISSAVTHFSTYAVIIKPSCQVDGMENAATFCNRQTWAQGTIGYFCAAEGKKFYMCWEAPNTWSSSIMSCPNGTSCSCCSNDECSDNNAQSPCR